ncbi:MAG TPA: lytic transglycosylase domain-containing protein [Solirubrobacteraceae bacterium]|jgi:soluble lytic murein transglycosylase|nr:lytic transglycosylase domain-containing protein [Solirubrobacteraceae bacterium]
MSRRTRAATVTGVVGILLVVVVLSEVKHEVSHRGLPLTDAGIIREQAAAKHLDPALIAAVIYAETKFDPRPSAAGAQGLMQILPATAYYLAHLSGGTRFTASDLGTPSINLAYGSYYLRYLLDHYNGNEMLAVAAYNGGLANVDSWAAQANSAGEHLTVAAIPFPETRAYVQRVLSAEQAYRATYPQELGLR